MMLTITLCALRFKLINISPIEGKSNFPLEVNTEHHFPHDSRQWMSLSSLGDFTKHPVIVNFVST